MSREPIRLHRNFQTKKMPPQLLWDIRRRFHRLSPKDGHVAHALRTLPPVAAKVLLLRAAPRLACVKPAASVHPEPGSNSSLYILYIFLSLPRRTQFPKEINALEFFVLGTCCTYSFNIFKELPLHFKAGCKDNYFFFPSKLFLIIYTIILYL